MKRTLAKAFLYITVLCLLAAVAVSCCSTRPYCPAYDNHKYKVEPLPY